MVKVTMVYYKKIRFMVTYVVKKITLVKVTMVYYKKVRFIFLGHQVKKTSKFYLGGCLGDVDKHEDFNQ